jgi:methyl-accepting chemotaxis protein
VTLLDSLKRESTERRSTLLMNRDGVYFVHPDPAKEWGADLEHGESFRREYPGIAQTVLSGDSGVTRYQGRFLAYRPVYPRAGDKNQFWVEAQVVPEEVVLAEASRFRWGVLGLLIASVAITIVAGVLLTWRMISVPLQQTARVLEAVAGGDLGAQVQVTSRDEVGRMGLALNRAIEALRKAAATEKQQSDRERRQAEELHQKVSSILAVVNAAAAGDLTQPVSVQGSDAIGQMGEGLATFLRQLRSNVTHIAGMAQDLASSSQQLTAVSGQMAANAEQTAAQANGACAAAEEVSANVQSVATGIEEMGASIREIAKNANEAAQIATTGVKVAQATNATMYKLGESSEEIGKVIKVITSIAQQTNLLALNAAIEAARAGEAGKGFAVVANAVKELATRTGQSTEDISRKIETMQTDARGAVSAIEQIGKIINEINDIQTTIASAVEEQTATAGEMTRNIGEAAKGSSDIAANVGGVAEAARSTKEGAANTKQAADGLSGMAQNLKKMVAQFRC